MFKVIVIYKKNKYEIKVYDYEFNRWCASHNGTLFRTIEDAKFMKSILIKLNNKNIKDVIIEDIRRYKND